jgi:hypothetical protein
LQKTSQNLTALTAHDSVLTGTLKNFEGVGANLKGITEKGGGVDSALTRLQDVLSNVKDVTGQLEKDDNLEKTLANFKAASARLKIILDSLDRTMNSVLPRLDLIVQDVNQLTDKLKRQPWRVVWPTTIKYPEGQQGGEAPPWMRENGDRGSRGMSCSQALPALPMQARRVLPGGGAESELLASRRPLAWLRGLARFV